MNVPLSVRMPLLAAKAAVEVKVRQRMYGAELSKAVARSRSEPRGPAYWGHSLFSQNGEDGVLAAILDRIGVGPRKFVEFGFSPMQNNTLAFALREKATGMYLDGSKRICTEARHMFRMLMRTDIDVVCAWLDRDNIDGLLAKRFGGQELDILSVDVDGNDYWMWQAIHSVNPRIVITEYNASFGAQRAVSVPYDPAFDRHTKPTDFYHGMSLRAAHKLGLEKGYALIGCDQDGVNAFFVRRDLLPDGAVVERTPEESFRPNRWRITNGFVQQRQEAMVYALPVVDV
ncbi:MAG TPA: hypothetical protein VL326_08535 [Kofleriaceae bacterium]|jgi:hypothetical protein|nr:hypothetical protein [Kofleriaceae bacterium]